MAVIVLAKCQPGQCKRDSAHQRARERQRGGDGVCERVRVCVFAVCALSSSKLERRQIATLKKLAYFMRSLALALAMCLISKKKKFMKKHTQKIGVIMARLLQSLSCKFSPPSMNEICPFYPHRVRHSQEREREQQREREREQSLKLERTADWFSVSSPPCLPGSRLKCPGT